MKSLSLKLDDKVFNYTEEITGELKLDRNRYINDAVELYNLFNKRQLLKKKLDSFGVPNVYCLVPGWPHTMDIDLRVNKYFKATMADFFEKYVK